MLPIEDHHLNFILLRYIGVYYPAKLKQKNFRLGGKIMIAITWILSSLPILMTLSQAWGSHGLECKTRKCAIINHSEEVNPRLVIGQTTVIITLLLLVVFNTAIYLKLKVRANRLMQI